MFIGDKGPRDHSSVHHEGSDQHVQEEHVASVLDGGPVASQDDHRHEDACQRHQEDGRGHQSDHGGAGELDFGEGDRVVAVVDDESRKVLTHLAVSEQAIRVSLERGSEFGHVGATGVNEGPITHAFDGFAYTCPLFGGHEVTWFVDKLCAAPIVNNIKHRFTNIYLQIFENILKIFRKYLENI